MVLTPHRKLGVVLLVTLLAVCRAAHDACGTTFATTFSMLAEPAVGLAQTDDIYSFDIDAEYYRGASLYVGFVPHTHAMAATLGNNAVFPSAELLENTTWRPDASGMCEFDAANATARTLSNDSYPETGKIWERVVTGCTRVQYAASLPFATLYALARNESCKSVFAVSARNSSVSISGFLYVTYIGDSSAAVASWSYPFTAQSTFYSSETDTSEDLDVIVQSSSEFLLASIHRPADETLLCNMSSVMHFQYKNGSDSAEAIPLTSTKLSCECDFGCLNDENIYSVQIPLSTLNLHDPNVVGYRVDLTFDTRDCQNATVESCNSAGQETRYFVISKEYFGILAGSTQSPILRVMNGGQKTVDSQALQKIYLRAGLQDTPPNAGPVIAKAVIYRGNGESTTIYETVNGTGAACGAHAELIEEGRALSFMVPQSQVLIGQGNLPTPPALISDDLYSKVCTWFATGPSACASLLDLGLQSPYVSEQVELERWDLSCTEVTIALPNTTEPNSTEPNSTEPDPDPVPPTVNCTLEPDHPNCTDNGTDPSTGDFDYRRGLRALPVAAAALIAGVAFLL